MLINGASGTFAHKKTIKQFLQPMTKRVLGGRGGCAAIFGSVFQSYYIFVLVFLIHQCLFWIDFTSICIFFAVYYVYVFKNSNSAFGYKILLMYN